MRYPSECLEKSSARREVVRDACNLVEVFWIIKGHSDPPKLAPGESRWLRNRVLRITEKPSLLVGSGDFDRSGNRQSTLCAKQRRPVTI